MKNLKEFSAHSNYAAFLQTANYITPNVSLCVTENEVHYNPYVAPASIPVEGDIQIFDDAECTRYATGVKNAGQGIKYMLV